MTSPQFAFALVFAISLVTLCSSQSTTGCTQNGAWNDTAFQALIFQLEDESNELLRQDILENSVAITAQGFTAKQTVQILMEFDNEIIAEEILVNISRWILALYSTDSALILEQWDNELIRLDVLPYLVNLTIDLRTQNQTILDEFSNIFNKRDAMTIIENAAPISCVWGNLSPQRLIFVVDTSGSMSTTFVDGETGNTYTRLGYVAVQLDQVIRYNLQPTQEFNIISFSDYPSAWQPGIVPVTSSNINSAVSFVSRLSPGGGTAMLSALRYAFSDPNAVAIYLLSDGQPTDSSFQQILNAASQWSQGTKPLNAISFQAGGTYDPNAASFMYQLAQETGGIYRSIV